jgi:hypothetical protein
MRFAGGFIVKRQEQIKALEKDWAENSRWADVTRDYSAEDVVRLRGSVLEEYTLAKRGAEKLWKLVNEEDYINCMGAITSRPASRPFIFPVGKWLLTATLPKPCTRTSHCMPITRSRPWSAV